MSATESTTRLASLPLFRLPELETAKTNFWNAVAVELARAGGAGADLDLALDLARPTVPERVEPETLFTQLCGYPLRKLFSSEARVLAAPVYDADYCEGPTHCGVFVVRLDAVYDRLEDLRGCRFVFGGPFSNSGMNLPRRAIAEVAGGSPFFATAEETDSQGGNLEAVASGEMDATCVDCVTLAFATRHRPHVTASLRVLAPTPRSPSIPFVTSMATDASTVNRLQQALGAVATSPEWAEARRGLMLLDIVPIDPDAYDVLLEYEREAVALGYPVLC